MTTVMISDDRGQANDDGDKDDDGDGDGDDDGDGDGDDDANDDDDDKGEDEEEFLPSPLHKSHTQASWSGSSRRDSPCTSGRCR